MADSSTLDVSADGAHPPSPPSSFSSSRAEGKEEAEAAPAAREEEEDDEEEEGPAPAAADEAGRLALTSSHPQSVLEVVLLKLESACFAPALAAMRGALLPLAQGSSSPSPSPSFSPSHPPFFGSCWGATAMSGRDEIGAGWRCCDAPAGIAAITLLATSPRLTLIADAVNATDGLRDSGPSLLPTFVVVFAVLLCPPSSLALASSSSRV
jgi:hypothetical protein